MRSTITRLIILLVLLQVVADYPTAAHETPVVGFLFIATENGIDINSVNSLGELAQINLLPNNIAIEDFGEGEWVIESGFDFKASPDGNNIAFTATNPSTSESALFIYNILDKTLTKRTLSEKFLPQWFPESQMLFLTNRDHTFVYDLLADNLTQFAPFGIWEPVWLPDKKGIVFVGRGIRCPAPCNAFNDLYVINRDGKGYRAITNLGKEMPAEVVLTICEPRWVGWLERIYFRVGCGGFPAVIEYIYSTDLSGGIRLENAPSDEYISTRRAPNIIVDNSGQNIYVSMNEQGIGTYWKILRLRSNQFPNTIFDYLFSRGLLQNVTLSPNGMYFGLSANISTSDSKNGLIWIIKRENGLIYAVNNGLANICQLIWSNDTTIIFTQETDGNPSCVDENFPIGSRSLSKFDLMTGEVTSLTGQFDAPTFFIAVPQI